MLGVGELEREGVRPGLEFHRALLLRLTEVQVGGVEGNLDSLLDVSPLLVHDDVVVAGPLLQALARGRQLVSDDAHLDIELLRHGRAVLWLDPVHAVLAVLRGRGAGGHRESHRRAHRAAQERAPGANRRDDSVGAPLGHHRLGDLGGLGRLGPEGREGGSESGEGRHSVHPGLCSLRLGERDGESDFLGG